MNPTEKVHMAYAFSKGRENAHEVQNPHFIFNFELKCSTKDLTAPIHQVSIVIRCPLKQNTFVLRMSYGSAVSSKIETLGMFQNIIGNNPVSMHTALNFIIVSIL